MRLALLLCAVALLLTSVVAQAGPGDKATVAAADTGPSDGGSGGAPGAAVEPTPPDAKAPDDVKQLRKTAAQIRAFLAGDLDLSVDPASLFEVNFDNDRAIRVQARRLRTMLDAETARDAGASGGGGAGGEGGDDGGGGEGGASGSDRQPKADADDALLDAQLDVDRARLSFYEMPAERRAALVATHAQRKKEADEHELAVKRAERESKEAEERKVELLRKAAEANDKTEQLMLEELGRLEGISSENLKFKTDLFGQEKTLEEASPPWLQRETAVHELLEDLLDGSAFSQSADAAYDTVANELATTRTAMRESLDEYPNGTSKVQAAGTGPLSDVDEQTPKIRELRKTIAGQLEEIRPIERRVNLERRRILARYLERLNSMRLALLPYLSPDKRNALLGFGPKGRAQADRELDQVKLVVRHHMSMSREWVRAFDGRSFDRDQRFKYGWTALKWLALLVVFIWWYRRIDGWLEAWQNRMRDAQPRCYGRERAIRFLRRVRLPLEWLLFFGVAGQLLPDQYGAQLEVDLIGIVLIWSLGEAIVVNGMDALVSGRRVRTKHGIEVGRIRLKSLHLIGRAVVLFGMTLSLLSRLMGEGTIYTWVMRTCWYAALPIVLVVLRWWKPIILRRIAAHPKHTPFTQWVTDRGNGWASFAATTAGGSYLLFRATNRFIRRYITGFAFIRKLLAYWFRRELSKKEQSEASPPSIGRPPLHKLERLNPEAEATEIVPSVADPQVDDVIARIDAPGGGVFAVVGEHGSGKSTLLRRIGEKTRSVLVACPPEGMSGFLPALRAALDLASDATEAELRKRVDAMEDDTAILVDDAHHLVRPVIGGLDDFDHLLGLARESSVERCTWVFALDDIIWQFVGRARGARPMFDDVIALKPWSEEGITRLLKSRTAGAALTPHFDALLTDLQKGSDEFDRSEAVARAETNYYRLLWDYARGNPAIALHFWGKSLDLDPEGREMVRLFRPPPSTDLETLPDSAVFVLRGVLQLGRATVQDLVATTMLPMDRVRDALRYAHTRGYVESIDGRYRVCWEWVRAIANFLERRHLLVNRR